MQQEQNTKENSELLNVYLKSFYTLNKSNTGKYTKQQINESLFKSNEYKKIFRNIVSSEIPSNNNYKAIVNYTPINTVTNGDCFFDSIIQSINKSKNKNKLNFAKLNDAKTILRQNVVEYIKHKDSKNKNSTEMQYKLNYHYPSMLIHNQKFTANSLQSKNPNTIKTMYYELMKTSGTWTSPIEWKATAEYLKDKHGILLLRIEKKNGRNIVNINTTDNGKQKLTRIYISAANEIHFKGVTDIKHTA
jgi:hypothetical protein